MRETEKEKERRRGEREREREREKERETFLAVDRQLRNRFSMHFLRYLPFSGACLLISRIK